MNKDTRSGYQNCSVTLYRPVTLNWIRRHQLQRNVLAIAKEPVDVVERLLQYRLRLCDCKKLDTTEHIPATMLITTQNDYSFTKHDRNMKTVIIGITIRCVAVWSTAF